MIMILLMSCLFGILISQPVHFSMHDIIFTMEGIEGSTLSWHTFLPYIITHNSRKCKENL